VFSDIEAELHSVVAEGDEVAVYETLTMTHVGTLMGIEPTGRRVSGRTMTFYRFEEEGKIAESWGMEELEVIAAKLESPTRADCSRTPLFTRLPRRLEFCEILL
jgi:predicted ester cyclase